MQMAGSAERSRRGSDKAVYVAHGLALTPAAVQQPHAAQQEPDYQGGEQQRGHGVFLAFGHRHLRERSMPATGAISEGHPRAPLQSLTGRGRPDLDGGRQSRRSLPMPRGEGRSSPGQGRGRRRWYALRMDTSPNNPPEDPWRPWE